MGELRSKDQHKIIFLKNINNHTILWISFFKWTFIGSLVGILTGSASALFLKSLEIATNLRIKNPWLLFLLPFGGALVSFIYSKYRKNSYIRKQFNY